ncbi:Site-specific DNA recombinase [Malonomonas rubra DSM 5091]|uniref:Site-specific DNA recombinase n=1 Tax=Malonomonas rubra DSM 5091 TaxID=1122189 RepID=A0A1M6L5H9_MALRU|nr:recombinase family protein [Malonomonas rubra]SHJ66445.1 Site-specific DNA recombinase [Malonomonas rubra DSM 5091]
MAIVGYARVSTADQSLDVQVGQLNAAGCEKIFSEKVSGSKLDRAQLNALLGYVREGDTVICTKMDRIARSTKHLLDIVDELKQQNIAFKVLNINLDTATPTGKLMLTMLGAIAEFERELMLERQREGIEKAKAAGKYKGRKPTAREKSQDIIRLLNQGMQKAQIAKELGIGLSSVYRVLDEMQKKILL